MATRARAREAETPHCQATQVLGEADPGPGPGVGGQHGGDEVDQPAGGGVQDAAHFGDLAFQAGHLGLPVSHRTNRVEHMFDSTHPTASPTIGISRRAAATDRTSARDRRRERTIRT